MVKVKQALLSCADKTGLEPFARELVGLGVSLLASGGTADHLRQQGLRVKSVEDFAGITEQLDGRVKTLHPKIHAGILARRDDPAHVRAAGRDGLIDLVVVNLYPFQQAIERPGARLDDAIEQIDIGGVALLRAAAKNFAHVAAICRPDQYAAVIAALREGKGTLPERLSRELAVTAFRLTGGYDAVISEYLSSTNGAAAGLRALPASASMRLDQRQTLRYGENPHQQGAWYAPSGEPAWGLGTVTQLQGKELSYNNLLDADAALRCLLEFSDPACAIIKHSSLCGLAASPSLQDAYARALACDAESAFGGVVGLNRAVDAGMASALTGTFLEVILAPSVAPEAVDRFRKKPNLRVITVDWPPRPPAGLEWRQLLGSWLLQEPDVAPLQDSTLRVASKRQPTDRERRSLEFAWTAAKHVRSNGVVLAAERETVGIGQGQPSRVGSVRLAIDKARTRARDSVAASDGFFPFADGVELLAKAGVSAVIQPGGSIRDGEVIAAADAAGMAMVLTGVRHFRH
jgi:phosphoribosylaminoimidazolecarboxamide formyltransferase/IMP cyclohydrolase